MHAHPGMFEISNLHRIKGYTPPAANADYKESDLSAPIGIDCAAYTGAKSPSGGPVKFSSGKTDLNFGAGKTPKGCYFCCCVIAPMMCSNYDTCWPGNCAIPFCCCCCGPWCVIAGDCRHRWLYTLVLTCRGGGGWEKWCVVYFHL